MKRVIIGTVLGTAMAFAACGGTASPEGTGCAAGAGAGGVEDDGSPLAPTAGEPPSVGGEPPSSIVGGAGGVGTPPEPEGGTGGNPSPEQEAGAAGIASGGLGSGGEGGAPEPTTIAPDDLDGLVLWLEASTNACVRDAQDQVSSCSDLSGLANHATQADLARQPTFVAGVPPTRPTLRFDDEPSILSIADAPSLRFGEGDVTFLVVGRWRNEIQPSGPYAGAGILLGKQNAVFPYMGLVFFANYQSLYNAQSMSRFAVQLALGGTVGLSTSGGLNDDVFRLYVIHRVGQYVELRINGAFEGRTQIIEPTSLDGMGVPLTLGGQPGYQFRGDVSEVVVIGGALPESDLMRLENGLLSKHGL